MKITRHLLAPLFVLLFATSAATAAFAQGPRGPGGPGGPGPGGAPLAMLLLDTQVAGTLALTSGQQALWNTLRAAEQAARAERDSAHSTLQALVAAQYASGAPDLVAIEEAMAAQHQAMATAGAAISNQAVALYTQLSTGQQSLVATAAQARYQQGPQR